MFPIRRKKKSPSQFPISKPKRSPNLIKRLDKVFSAYIRVRDAMPNGYFRCISCGQIKTFDKADCGHYWSRSHMATRFSEDNCSAECSYCNRMTGGEHMIGYRENLIRKIGQSRFDYLTVAHNQTKKWSDFELQAMIDHYRKEAKRIASEKNIKLNI